LDKLVLPEHLSVLMSGRQYIDVVGTARPWPIPTGWWGHARQRVRELVADPRVGASQDWTGWPLGTRDVAPFLQNLAMSLGGYVAIFSGEFAQFPEQLVDEFLASEQRREPMVARNWYLTDTEWPLFLIKYAAPDPVSRRAALELSYDCVTFLSEVGPLEARAFALLGIYERVLHSGNLLEYHLTAAFPEVARLWRQSLLSETERALLPEIGGWGAALKWSYAGLGAAHHHLSESTGRVETLPEVVASMALCDNLDNLPATLAAAVGSEDFDEISAVHDAYRPVSTRRTGCRRIGAGWLRACWPARSTRVAPGSPWRRRYPGSSPACPGRRDHPRPPTRSGSSPTWRSCSPRNAV